MRFIRKFFHFWFGGLAEKCGTGFVITALLAAMSSLTLLHNWPGTLLLFFAILAAGYIKKKQ